MSFNIPIVVWPETHLSKFSKMDQLYTIKYKSFDVYLKMALIRLMDLLLSTARKGQQFRGLQEPIIKRAMITDDTIILAKN